MNHINNKRRPCPPCPCPPPCSIRYGEIVPKPFPKPFCPFFIICPTGATGATGASGFTTQLRGLQVQLVGPLSTVTSGSPVIFDTIVNDLSLFLSFDNTTGEFTISQTGVFYINWWVSINGMGGGLDIVPTFSIVSSQGDDVQGSSPLMVSQISGNALLDVPVAPVTFTLVNATDSTISYYTTPIQANLSIINVTF